MSKINDGGPAFARAESGYFTGGSVGMSLRDWFAGQALAGLIANETIGSMRSMDSDAERVYAMADAMLAARAKKTSA